MIQDIAPHFLDNHYEPGKKPSSDSPVVCFNGKDVLLLRRLRNALSTLRWQKATPRWAICTSSPPTVSCPKTRMSASCLRTTV